MTKTAIVPFDIIPAQRNATGILQLSKIEVNEAYRKKWNVHENDFVCLTRNGQLLRNTLYRIGGLNHPKPESDAYFMLLKHVEAFYDDSITTDPKRKPHLESRWCIIDKHGDEKVVFKPFKHGYLVKDSMLYTMEGKYYNIETGAFYGYAANHCESSEYVFIENRWDEDETKRGVQKIHKKTGTVELFK